VGIEKCAQSARADDSSPPLHVRQGSRPRDLHSSSMAPPIVVAVKVEHRDRRAIRSALWNSADGKSSTPAT